MSENRVYEDKQIARVEGNKKLLELQDYLEKNENPSKVKPLSCDSKERLVLVDYSSEGENNISVYFNLDEKCLFTLHKLAATRRDFKKDETRIYGEPDEKGLSIVKKLTVTRQGADQQGKPKNYPFYICIEDGRGVKLKSQTGGFYLKSGTFVCEKKAYVNLAQLDFEYLLDKGVRYWHEIEAFHRKEQFFTGLLASNFNTYYKAEKAMVDGLLKSSITPAKEEIIKNINELPM